MTKSFKLILVGLAFNGYWLLAAFGQNAALLALCLIPLIVFSCYFKQFGFTVIIAALLGMIIDWCWIQLGLFHFPDSHTLPFWMMALWFTFSLWWRWLLTQIHLTLPMISLLGALTGPLSYWFASRLNNTVIFDISLSYALPILGLSWGIYLPLASIKRR